MKQLIAVAATAVFIIVIIIPAVVVRVLDMTWNTPPAKSGTAKTEDIPIRVYLPEIDKIVEMSLEEYVKGVIAAEMPAEFEKEALKAQAVAARTYAVKHMVLFGGAGAPNRPGADVSTDHRESQAWLSEQQLKTRWGPFAYSRYWEKISQAADETRGLIVTYNGEPIKAVFHSTSGERTASAKEVWGFDYPYLVSVPCKWDKDSSRYHDTKEYTLAQIEERLGADAGVIAAAKSGSGSVAGVIEHTDSGRVGKVRIGSKTFSGLEVREKLDLRSANFAIEMKNDKIVFKTTGYGHGVGLCQYGANGMAKEGKTYREILTYYYPGVAIRHISGS